MLACSPWITKGELMVGGKGLFQFLLSKTVVVCQIALPFAHYVSVCCFLTLILKALTCLAAMKVCISQPSLVNICWVPSLNRVLWLSRKKLKDWNDSDMWMGIHARINHPQELYNPHIYSYCSVMESEVAQNALFKHRDVFSWNHTLHQIKLFQSHQLWKME